MAVGDHAKKNPAFRRDFPCLVTFELAILWRLLALTVRILLLLPGLLTATLLLARLLAGILVLLTGILVLVRHRRSPLFNVVQNNWEARAWYRGNRGFRDDHCLAIVWHKCGRGTGTPK
jgi:hypothetical protein